MFYCSCCLVFDILVVRQWGLEERWLVLACQLVKTDAVYQSVGSLSQTEDFHKD